MSQDAAPCAVLCHYAAQAAINSAAGACPVPDERAELHNSVLRAAVQPVHGLGRSNRDPARFVKAGGHKDLFYVADADVDFAKVRGADLRLPSPGSSLLHARCRFLCALVSRTTPNP